MAIVINLETRGVNSTIQNLEKSIGRLEDSIRRVNGLLGQTGRLTGRAASGAGGAAPRAGASRRPVFNTIQDEIQWLRTQPGWRRQDQADRLQRRLNMAGAPPWARFMRGAGQGMGAFGGGAGAAAIARIMPLLTNPVTAAAAAVSGLAAAAHFAAKSFMALALKAAMFGGGTGAASAASMLGDPRQFQSNIQQGMGAAYAQMAGINIVGGPFGDMNYSAKLLKYMEFIWKSGSFEEARRRSEGVGMPELATNYYLSDENKRYLRDKASQRTSGQSIRGAVNYDFAVKKFLDAWEKFKRAFGGTFMPMMTRGLELASKMMELLGKVNWQAALNPIIALMEYILALIKKLKGGGEDDRESKSRERHRKAMDDHSRAMDENRHIMGGRGRARNAIPDGISGRNLDLATMDRLRGALI